MAVVTDYGLQIEEHARQLAAGLGVPDFVYRPATVRKGSGEREISDGLLVAGGRGLILQVKSRAPDAASEDTNERAAAWIAKHAADAVRQANGTRRSLAKHTSRPFVSMRGYERTLPRGDDWPAVVLIDHQNAPPVALTNEPNVLYMSLLDWMNIHDRLRSTDAVIEYAHRALASGLRPALGEEFGRYRRLAQADADFAHRPGSLPILPLDRPTTEELFAVRAFDDLVERVADNTNSPWDASNYLPVVELLDRQPILLRAHIGQKMIDTFLKVRADGSRRGFIARDQQAGDRIAFIYDVEPRNEPPPDIDEGQIAEIAAYGALRHAQALETGAALDSRTLAVGVRHLEHVGRRYAFALFEGPAPPMDDEMRRMLEVDHGIYRNDSARMARRRVGRNEICPCGSGRKYKRCCARSK
jgi:hypothetical protein